MNFLPRAMLAVSLVGLALSALSSTPPSVPGSAGGLSDPLKIREIKITFGYGGQGQPRKSFNADQPISGFSALVYFTGAGTVSGRWEVVRPGQSLPTTYHHMPDFEVPSLARASMERYPVVDTFIENFSATGRHVIPGPDTKKLPRNLPGIYKVLLRIDSISSITEQNPAQPGLLIPFLQYTIQGVSPQ